MTPVVIYDLWRSRTNIAESCFIFYAYNRLSEMSSPQWDDCPFEGHKVLSVVHQSSIVLCFDGRSLAIKASAKTTKCKKGL